MAIILDNPGARETSEGLPYVCGTRQTLIEAIAEAGIRREDLYVTFLLKCRPRRKYDRQAAWSDGLPLLLEQLRLIRPKVLICMGNTVIKALTNVDNEVKAMRGKRWDFAGIPAVVTYHPLAVRRRPNLRPYLLSDLKIAGVLLAKSNG